MKITKISTQARDKNRVNIFVDNKYEFSLDVLQVVDLGLKVGNDYSDEELAGLEREGEYSKLYTRALEYCFVRPRSVKEIKDYLWRKTLVSRRRSKRTGLVVEMPGVSQAMADRVLNRLRDKQYVDDEKFARYWFENRRKTKGVSVRKLRLELKSKGVSEDLISVLEHENIRSDKTELEKIIAKKSSRYDDENKLIQYLMRQGFLYDDIKSTLSRID